MSNDEKKVLSRHEFNEKLASHAAEMKQDKKLYQDALDVKVRAGHDYYWVHQTKWLGEPCLQLPQDLITLQETIYKCKSDYIIELGVCWGGSTLIMANILDIVGGTGIIGVDIYMPEYVRTAIQSKKAQNINIDLYENSSTDLEIFEKVKSQVAG
jgi:cephalosporin hydroxylase